MNKNMFTALLLSFVVSASQAAPQLLNGVAAIVNDDVILNSEFERGLERIRAQLQEAGQAVDDQQVLREQVMERLISRKVQAQKAKELGLRVDDSELNRTLQRIARNNQMSLSQFRQALLAEGVDYRDFREEVREEVLLAQLKKRQVEMQTKVSDQELDDFLSLRQRVLKNSFEYRLRHILIATGEGDDLALIAKARARADRVLTKVQAGADFAALAMRTSDGQYALEGGDLGWRKLEQLPKVFVEALQTAKEGDLLGPLRSASGFHLLLLEQSRGEERHYIKQSHARHILLRVTEVRDSEATLKTLKSLRKRIVAGEKFAALAKEFSDDPGSAVAGGDLGWFGPM
ncbi:MAG: peptidylprolyl isomerase [Gammaproteobacteria bacterium]|nr:peptidylprolyl isomerase [Gammaproteobacteria bacterium]